MPWDILLFPFPSVFDLLWFPIVPFDGPSSNRLDGLYHLEGFISRINYCDLGFFLDLDWFSSNFFSSEKKVKVYHEKRHTNQIPSHAKPILQNVHNEKSGPKRKLNRVFPKKFKKNNPIYHNLVCGNAFFHLQWSRKYFFNSKAWV